MEKKIGYNDSALKTFKHDDLAPLEESVQLSNKVGFSDSPMSKNNVRELKQALVGMNQFYVASTSGGSPETLVTVLDGVIVSIE